VVTKGPIVIKEFKHDTGPPLREVAPLLPEFGTPSEHEIENNVNPNHPWSNKVQKDPVLQTAENSPSLQTQLVLVHPHRAPLRGWKHRPGE
jgi:hypothetical protein